MHKPSNWLESIQMPTLVIWEERARANICRMAEKARRHDLRFRPHFKTHQSVRVGEWFRDYGIREITVSSLEMAEFFAGQGWKDITVAFPVNLREMGRINSLAENIRLNLLVEDEEVAARLSRGLHYPVQVWIKVDVGAGRTGLPAQDVAKLTRLAKKITLLPRLQFAGLLTHAGHTYQSRSRERILTIHKKSIMLMQTAAKQIAGQGIEVLQISIGDTPGCSLAEDFTGVDEIRPGNFVYYDLMQRHLGSCGEEDISAAIACPVVSLHPERNEAVIYGGAVHLSKEGLMEPGGQTVYGRPVPAQQNGWGKISEDVWVDRISQEHGILKTGKTIFTNLHVGDVVMILPVHSCLAANLLRSANRQIFLPLSQPG